MRARVEGPCVESTATANTYVGIAASEHVGTAAAFEPALSKRSGRRGCPESKARQRLCIHLRGLPRDENLPAVSLEIVKQCSNWGKEEQQDKRYCLLQVVRLVEAEPEVPHGNP